MIMDGRKAKKIILESGSEFYGYSFGADKESLLEIVFNTSMVGYQEILSDPSYTNQAVVMTYPLIGNYGIAEEDFESDRPTIGALIVHEYNDEPSNYRSCETLENVMKRFDIPGVFGVDTRKINRIIRDLGSQTVLITDPSVTKEEGLRRIRSYVPPKDAVPSVSCKNIYFAGPSESRLKAVIIDCGMKKNILRSLNERGVYAAVVPWNTSFETIEKLDPSGILISNGPGDPQDVPETIETARKIAGKYPMFGICLGHQIISLAYGASTYKLKFGHRGGNHPVKNLDTGRIEITSQNHSYAVDARSLSETPLKVTHINILDNTVEGLKCEEDKVFTVQYHPESAPGPCDSSYLFDDFISMIKEKG